MTTADIKRIFPFLKNLNLDDPKVRRSVIAFSLAGAVLMAILIMLILNPFKGEATQSVSIQDTPADTTSVMLGTPDGVDRDNLDNNDMLAVRDRVSGRRRNFGEEVFEDAGRQVDASVDGSLAPKDSEKVASAKQAALKDTPAVTDGRPGEPGTDPNPIRRAVSGSEGQTGAETAAASSSTSSTTSSLSAEDQERIYKARKLLIDNGIDPDTGLRFDEDPHPTRKPSTSTTSRTTTGNPITETAKAAEGTTTETAAKTDGPGTASSTTSEGTTQAEDPLRTVPRSVIRSSGGVTSLSDGWDDQSGTIGSISSDATPRAGEDAAHPFEVMFVRDEKISSGERITVRLLEEMLIDGVRLPENTPLSGIANLNDSRLMITVNSVKVGDRIFTLNLVAYDTDGMPGLYCRQTDAARSVKEGLGETGSIISSALSSGIAGYTGQLVTSGASILRSKSGNLTVSVSSGYRFFLVREQR